MRVMLVVHGFPPSQSGGTELYAHDLAMELNHQFDDQVVVLSREADPRREELSVRWERRNGVRVAYINNTFKLCRSFEQTYRHDGVRKRAADLMDQVDPEVVHIHHLTGLSTDLVSETRRRGIPTLFTLHDYWLLCQRGQLLDLEHQRCPGPSPERCARCVGQAAGAGPAMFHGASLVRALESRAPLAGLAARAAARRLSTVWTTRAAALEQMARRLDHVRQVCGRVTCFLAPSRTLRQRFLDFGVPEGLISLAALGVDPTRFEGVERPAGTRQLRLGFIGSLIPSKGPHLLLQAFAGLPEGAATLQVLGGHLPYHGDNGYRRQLEPLLSFPGVEHLGPVPHEKIPEALASLDALVVPSTWMENAPIVVQEAFLAGVPVVASRLGGLAEAVQHGKNGLLFRPGDAGDLERTLKRLLNEPALLVGLRQGIPKVRTLSEDARSLRARYLRALPASRRPRRTPKRRRLPLADGVEQLRTQPSALPAKRPRRLFAIVLNWGTPCETLEAVRALQASNRPVDRILVVDNGSPDSSDAILRRHLEPRGISVIQTGENLGFSGGNNVGIRLALRQGAERILLVNSDVTLDPDCIDRLEQALDHNPRWGIAGPRVLARSAPNIVASLGIRYSPGSGRMKHVGFGLDVGAHTVAPYQEVDGVSGCAMLIRVELLQQVGLLAEEYFFSFEDLELCLRARRAGFATVTVGAAAAFHEGNCSIGKRSPRRIYFATRNHLMMTRQISPALPPHALLRSSLILGLNLAHVLLTADTPRLEGLRAMLQGLWDHLWRKYGDSP